jgi:predicted nucleotidyltransferase
MQRNEALAILQEHRQDLERFGVRSIAIFGSVARNEARPDSDVDVLVEFAAPVGFFELIRLEQHLADLFGRRVDLTTPGGLKRQLRDRILREAVYAA